MPEGLEDEVEEKKQLEDEERKGVQEESVGVDEGEGRGMRGMD